jgi:hypothetical protein
LRPAVVYDGPRKLHLFRSLLDGLATVPGVKAAGANRVLLLMGGRWDSGITMSGVETADGRPPWSFFNAVTPGYFEALGLLAQGRDVTPDREIIGVFGNSRYDDVRGNIPRQVFVSLDSKIDFTDTVNVYARVQGDPFAAMPLLREQVRRIDANLVVSDMRTLDDQLNRRLSNERLLSFLSVGFALLASLLAVIGLHGVLTFVVARRTREIGIRVALGAARGSVIALVMREMLLVLLAGTAAGVAGGLFCGRLIESQLFGVQAADPPVFVISTVALLTASLVAAFMPAWRASRIDPMAALRHE